MLASCLALVLWGHCSRVPAAPVDTWVAQAKERLQEEQLVDAMAAAREATRVAPGDYRGHYYVALAHLRLSRLADASLAARRSLDLAPDGARAAVERLVRTVEERRRADDMAARAEAAEAEGLVAKAAALFAEAWSAGRGVPAHGLRAAELYDQRLSQPLVAGRLLWQVAESPESTALDVAAAKRQLVRLEPPLQARARELMATAAAQPAPEARRMLREARELAPDFAPLPLAELKLAALDDDPAPMRAALKELARLNQASVANLSGTPRLGHWLAQPEMQQYLRDLAGVSVLGELQAGVDLAFAEARAREEAKREAEAARQHAERARWQAYEEARRTYAREKVAYDAAVVQYEQDYKAVQRQHAVCLDGCTKRHVGLLWTDPTKLHQCYRFCGDRNDADSIRRPALPKEPKEPPR